MRKCIKGKPCGASCINLKLRCNVNLAQLKVWWAESGNQTVNDAVEELHRKVVVSSLPFAESNALKKYSETHFFRVNGYLREANGLDPEGPEAKLLQNQIDLMDSALRKIPPVKEPKQPLSRVEGYVDGRDWQEQRVKYLSNLKKGDSYQDTGFASFTGITVQSVKEIGRPGYSGVTGKETGHPLAKIPAVGDLQTAQDRNTVFRTFIFRYNGEESRNIARYSSRPKEDEYLLPRGHNMVVSGVTKRLEGIEEITEIILVDG